MNKLLSTLYDALEQAIEVYRANGKTNYDAGRVEGIKEAIEIIKKEGEG